MTKAIYIVTIPLLVLRTGEFSQNGCDSHALLRRGFQDYYTDDKSVDHCFKVFVKVRPLSATTKEAAHVALSKVPRKGCH